MLNFIMNEFIIQMRRNLFICLSVLFYILCSLGPSYAQKESQQVAGVGVYVSPPFVQKSDDGYSGMAIELWENIARDLQLQYRYREYNSFETLIDAVAKGEVQIAISNLTITKDRASRISFSQPWYDAGLRIMVANNERGGFWQVIGGLERAGHLRAMAWVAGIIAVATIILALFYRRFDKSFPRKWHHGLAESFYEVMSVATSGKITRPNIMGWVGRISGGLWMVCGVAVIAYMTSSVTSVMTALSLNHQIHSIADLPGHSIGVLGGSVAEYHGQELGLSLRNFNDMQSGVAALSEGQIDAIIGDAPVLEYYAYTHPSPPVSVVGAIFHPDKYGLGFQHGDPLTHEVTLQILARQENGEVAMLRRKYLGGQ